MLNVIPSNNLSITPMNYYLTFAASDTECELEMALRVNHQQFNKLADVVLLATATEQHIDIPLELPVEITRTMDAGDGLNAISENLSAKVVWLGIDHNGVTLSIAGYAHAVRVPWMLFESKIIELYTTLMGRSWQIDSQTGVRVGLGVFTTISLGERSVVRSDNMLIIASYSNGRRKDSQPMTLYVRDADGLWLQAHHIASPHWMQFVQHAQAI